MMRRMTGKAEGHSKQARCCKRCRGSAVREMSVNVGAIAKALQGPRHRSRSPDLQGEPDTLQLAIRSSIAEH